MFALSSSPPRHRRGTLKLLASSLILSMSLSGCLGAGKTRTQFLTPKFTPSELTCKGAPQGQLPSSATNGQVADRVVDIDEAGEDCRQKLERVKVKVEVYKEVADEISAGKKPKK